MRILTLALSFLVLVSAGRRQDSPHGSEFIISCQVCHSPRGWELDREIYSFNHNTTRLPLEGQHNSTNCRACHPTLVFSDAETDCFSCHTGTDYSNISAECISCHQTDFNNATNPNHLTSGFTKDCLECHSTSPGWKPASFKMHDAQYFPIYSGSHRGEWDNCIECHSNPSNYSIFSCIDCHAHSKSRMDNKHSDERGYQYASTACLDCHPTGRAD